MGLKRILLVSLQSNVVLIIPTNVAANASVGNGIGLKMSGSADASGGRPVNTMVSTMC